MKAISLPKKSIMKSATRFRDVNSVFSVDLNLNDDFHEIVGEDFKPDWTVGFEAMMVMEMLWLLDNTLTNTNKSLWADPFEVDKQKEYGIIKVMEDYLAPQRKSALWKYYYNRAIQRDIDNQLHVL